MRKSFIRCIIALSVSVAVVPAAEAQSQHSIFRTFNDNQYVDPPGWSLGMNFGLSDLWGDVGTKSPINHYTNDKYWNSPKFMGGLYVRYEPHPALGLRLGFSYGTLYANDNFNDSKARKASSEEDDAYQRDLRNLDVKDYVWEGQFLFEINPLRFNLKGGEHHSFQPYILLGVGGFHFDPKGTYHDPTGFAADKLVDLYDFHTEGEGMPGGPKEYSKWQMNIPFGLGFRFDVGPHLGLGVEYLYRYCFTDYLDDVSGFYYYSGDQTTSPQNAIADKSWVIDPKVHHAAGELRGNPAVKDAYSTISINFFYKIKTRKTQWWN